jgi:hypothetical protein
MVLQGLLGPIGQNMIAKIEQLANDAHGNLALYVTYWEDGQQVNAQRHALSMPVSKLVPYRDQNGLLQRLDGEPIPAEPTPEEQLLAEQVGIREEIVATDPAFIAQFAAERVGAYASVHRRAAALQAQAQAATDEQLLAMASGRATKWAQVQQVAAANGDTATAAKAAERLALAQSASADAALARQLALAEIAPVVATLTPETPWPSGQPDPRGYLQMPAVQALLGTEWEC